MKRVYTLFVIIFACTLIMAQSVSTNAFTSTGGSFSSKVFSIDYAIGEVVSGTLEEDNFILTQGVIQPEILNNIDVEKVIESKENISVYPNPFINYLIVSLNEINVKKVTIRLIDITGKVCLENEVTINSEKQEIQLDVKEFNKGIYFISVSSEDQLLKRTKLYKK